MEEEMEEAERREMAYPLFEKRSFGSGMAPSAGVAVGEVHILSINSALKSGLRTLESSKPCSSARRLRCNSIGR